MRTCTTPLSVILVVAGVLGTAGAAGTANAQSLDEALSLYKGEDFDEAAFAFYDVLQNDASAESRDQAEIYLAESLKKMGLQFPALFYYSDIFKAGRSTRFYLNAVNGLLELQAALHDPLFIPTLVNANFDAESFGKLEPAAIAQINYLIGELSSRQRRDSDAKAFLEYVAATSPYYPKSRYLLGIAAVRANDPAKARKYFGDVLQSVGEDARGEDEKRVRNLALLALARVQYGQGAYKDAVATYDQVPRFTDQWFDSMYESAWAHLQDQEYGMALGELQSVTAPYFAKRHIPEAYVIQGTAYFINCQWDRVRESVKTYKTQYASMQEQVQGYLGGTHDPTDYYRHVVSGGAGQFAPELARKIRSTARFRDYHFMLEHLAWERKQVEEVKVWKGSRLQTDILSIIDQHRDQLEPAVGRWVNVQLQNSLAQLKHFGSQVDILDFEVADAERRWLEQGKEILKGRRARLPRPGIPNDQWQHWSFDREYWKDELGYYAHTLRSECE